MRNRNGGEVIAKGSLKISTIEKYYTILALLLLIIIFSVTSPMFLTVRNIVNVLRQIAILTIVAEGLTLCRASGEMDLSVGAMVGFAGVLAAKLLVKGISPLVSSLISIAIGTGLGLLNGLLVTILRIPSLIATLGMLSIISGTTLTITNGKAIYSELPKGFAYIGQGYIVGIPFPVILMALVVIITHIILEYTRLGRYLYAIGENPTAAHLAGISVKFYKILSFALSGLLSSFGGIILLARLGSGQPTAGGEYLMEGLGAMFVGMTTYKPGQANAIGTLIGALLIGVITNGLLLMGISTYVQEIIKGLIVILAVIAAVYKEKIVI